MPVSRSRSGSSSVGAWRRLAGAAAIGVVGSTAVWLCAAALAQPAAAPVADPAPAAQAARPASAAQASRLAACTACHGPNGQSQAPGMPSLAGQPRLFIENQLVLIREGLRDVPAMQAVLSGIDDTEIVALATHFAGQPPTRSNEAVDAAQARAGAALAQRAMCGTCHLPDYRGQQQVPRLAGQRIDYLLPVLQQFRDGPGPGRDTIMSATLRGMRDADLAQLAHYLGSLAP